MVLVVFIMISILFIELMIFENCLLDIDILVKF